MDYEKKHRETRNLLGLKNRLCLPVFTDKDVAALEYCMTLAGKIQKNEAVYEQLCSLHHRICDILKKQ